jgi:DNA-binding MarR family transcriptional regulator
MSDVTTRTPEIPGSDLGWVLGVILRSWHEEVERVVAELPHGLRGFQILSVVGHNSPPTQSGLARHLNIDRTVMPYVIDSLVEAGFVQREVDSADRRVRRIVITDHGAETLMRLEGDVRAAEDGVFSGVSNQARETFERHAGELAISIHSARPYLDPCLAVLDVLSDAETPSPAPVP